VIQVKGNYPTIVVDDAELNSRSGVILESFANDDPFGGPGGPVASEIRSALYHVENSPVITNYICGLAGRDVTQDDFIKIYEESKSRANDSVNQSEYVYHGVRE
jgi:pyruvate ferredoxin oxidoreductase alpha subunit